MIILGKLIKVKTYTSNQSDKYPNPIGKSNQKDRYNRWENLSYHCPPLKKSNVRERITLLIKFTFDPPLGNQITFFQVVISRYAATLNKSINDKYSSQIGESNLQDRSDR